MTKFMWFQIISIFVILGLLITICAVEDKLVSDALYNVREYCYQIENAVIENDGIKNNEVNSLVENLEEKWLSDERNLCYVVNHKSIQEIGVEIIKLKTYIEEDDIREFSVSLELIKLYSEQYHHFMGANFKNVL